MITETDIKKVAHLARLNVDEHQLPTYSKSLSDILNMIEKISNINTNDIKPMASPLLHSIMSLREDKVTEINQRDVYQKVTKRIDSGYYVVPQVIE